MKDAVQAIVGRRIAHFILTIAPPGSVQAGQSRLYLVFTDGWYYELWAPEPILLAAGTLQDTLRSVLGKHIRKLRFVHCQRHPDWGPDYSASRLTISFYDGSSCGFYSNGPILTTSRLYDDGLLGALDYFPNDLVLLHVSATDPLQESSLTIGR